MRGVRYVVAAALTPDDKRVRCRVEKNFLNFKAYYSYYNYYYCYYYYNHYYQLFSLPLRSKEIITLHGNVT